MKKVTKLLIHIILVSIFLCGCGKTADEASSISSSGEDTVSEAVETVEEIHYSKIYFDVAVEVPEETFEEHSISLYLDEERVHEFKDSEYYTQLIDAPNGEHSISILFDEASVTEGQYSFTLDQDDSICFSISFQDVLFVSPIELKNNIDDSAISCPNVTGAPLEEALNKLESLHFVNVIYNSNSDATILDLSDWEIESQSITPGSSIDKATKIELSCKKVYHQFYFDLTFDSNLFLATYDIDVYLDGTMIDTIPHGKNFTFLTKLKEGDHEIVFYKNTNHDVKSSKNINITADSTLTGRLHSNNNDIELNDFVVKNSIENTSFEVANVEGMILEKALSTLASIGFINLSEDPSGEIWDRSNWVVISQSVKAGEIKDKNTPITLSCIKRSDYLSKYYLKLSIPEAMKKAEEMNNTIRFVDYVQNAYMDNKVSNMSAEDKEKWIVKQASYDSETINLAFVYTGNVEMPDLKSKPLTTALNMLKEKGFSAIETVTDDGSYIWDNKEWKVSKQSVDPGLLVNANGLITITVTKNKTQTANGATTTNNTSGGANSSSTGNNAGSSTNDNNAEFSFTTNDKATYKNGNSGKYAYKSRGGTYDRYYIIDFDDGCVYDFSEGNGDITCTKGYIKSGDLNSTLVVTYYDGDDSWESGFFFKWKNQPDHLCFQLDAESDWIVDFYSTDLSKALQLRDNKTIKDYKGDY